MLKTFLVFSLFLTLSGVYPLHTKTPVPAKPVSSPANDSHSKKLKNIHLVLRFGTTEQVLKVLQKVKGLKKEEQDEYLDQLDELLGSPNMMIQRKVIEVIGSIHSSILDEKLPPYLKSTFDEIFFTAVRSIDKKKIRASVSVIRELLKSTDFTKSNNRVPDMLGVLTTLQDESMADLLFEKLETPDTHAELKRRIMFYLASVGYKKAAMIKFLHSWAKDEKADQKLRSAAIYTIGKLKIDSAAPILLEEFKKIEELTDADEKRERQPLRRNIVYALVKLKNKEAEKILFTMARDDDESIRLKMIGYIKEIDSSRLKKLLEYQAKYDPAPRVQKAAKKALEELK